MLAALDVPEQGVKDWVASNVTLDDGHFSVEVPKAMAKISGTLKGDQVVGQWLQLGNSLPLTLKKGKYVAAPSYLDLPAAAAQQLKGRWSGTLNGLAVVVRFETDAQGRTRGFFDSTQQQLLNIPIAQARAHGHQAQFWPRCRRSLYGRARGQHADRRMGAARLAQAAAAGAHAGEVGSGPTAVEVCLRCCWLRLATLNRPGYSIEALVPSHRVSAPLAHVHRHGDRIFPLRRRHVQPLPAV